MWSTTEDSSWKEYPELQELCLTVIAENFDTLITSYKNVSESHWAFLARQFSETLLDRLKIKGALKAEHLDFFISPYVRELDLTGINRSMHHKVIDLLQIHGKNVKYLKAGGIEIAEPLLAKLISSLPNVATMEFTDCPPPKIFKEIGRSSGLLKTLDIGNSNHFGNRDSRKKYFVKRKYKFFASDVHPILTGCPQLENLHFMDSIGTMYELHRHHLFPGETGKGKLQLNFKSLFVRKQINSPLESARYALKTLCSENRDYPLFDALQVCIAFCPFVTSLCIDRLDVDGELQLCSAFQHLEEVRLNNFRRVTSTCLDHFLEQRGGKLVKLHVPSASVPSVLKYCPYLESLTLSDVMYFRFSNIDEIPGEISIPHLKTLKFEHSDFTVRWAGDALRCILSFAKNLKELSLSHSMGLTAQYLYSLNLYHIHDLDVSTSDIGTASLRELILDGSLQKINANRCAEISKADMFELKSYKAAGIGSTDEIEWALPPHDGMPCTTCLMESSF